MFKQNQNRILAALSIDGFSEIKDNLQLVKLLVGQSLFTPGHDEKCAYFPIDCLISLQHLMENGKSIESANVGNEGLVGLSLFMGGNSTPSSAVVVISGYAYKLDSAYFKKAFNNNKQLARLLLLYIQALMTQTAFTAVCNKHHSVQQHFCRWLLQCSDRVVTNDITITQELIANILGVRREGVSEVASILQREGLIFYRRGHIKVINRAGLEAHVCECYSTLKKELTRLNFLTV